MEELKAFIERLKEDIKNTESFADFQKLALEGMSLRGMKNERDRLETYVGDLDKYSQIKEELTGEPVDLAKEPVSKFPLLLEGVEKDAYGDIGKQISDDMKKKRFMVELRERLSDFAGRLGLAAGDVKESWLVLDGNWDPKRGRDPRSAAAASLYTLSFGTGEPITQHEVAQVTNVPEPRLRRYARSIHRFFGKPGRPLQKSLNEIEPFEKEFYATKLELSGAVVKETDRLLGTVRPLGRSPERLWAAALYFASRKLHDPRTEHEITGALKLFYDNYHLEKEALELPEPGVPGRKWKNVYNDIRMLFYEAGEEVPENDPKEYLPRLARAVVEFAAGRESLPGDEEGIAGRLTSAAGKTLDKMEPGYVRRWDPLNVAAGALYVSAKLEGGLDFVTQDYILAVTDISLKTLRDHGEGILGELGLPANL